MGVLRHQNQVAGAHTGQDHGLDPNRRTVHQKLRLLSTIGLSSQRLSFLTLVKGPVDIVNTQNLGDVSARSLRVQKGAKFTWKCNPSLVAWNLKR